MHSRYGGGEASHKKIKFMAKRKTKKSKTRRRRVGAMAMTASNPIVKYGSIAAGYLLAGKINPLIDKATGTLDQKIVAGGQVGIGVAYMITKGKKTLPLTVITGIIAGAGVKRAMTAFGVAGIGGYGAVPVIGQNVKRINGYQNVPVIGGSDGMGAYRTPGQLNGYTTASQKIMGTVGYTNASGLNSSSLGSDCMQ